MGWTVDYNIGEVLRADGQRYKIIGKIQYKNTEDNCRWMEYRLKHCENGGEYWLSADEVYDEYSLSQEAGEVSLEGFSRVDAGTQEVIGVWGKTDVEVGERASFIEYEDASGEKIISEEVWEDGREVSAGYYLDWNEVTVERTQPSQTTQKRKKKNLGFVIGMGLLGIFLLVFLFSSLFGKKTPIADYLKDSASYTYVTSITGSGKEKADVYRSALSVDGTARDLIDGIEGQTEDVQQNTEDGDDSIAILTEEEYCLIYTSEEQEVLVQISDRAYAYTTDKTPYRARRATHLYYRGFYYSRGYSRDRNSFGSKNSSYSDYDGDTVDYNGSDPYSSYSSSVRQSSVGSRTSSGGGLSSGK